MKDTLILIGIGITQLFLILYGVLVSVDDHKTRNTIVIISVGAIGLALTCWGGVNSGAWQSLMAGRLDKIEQNTEHDRPVNVTVPAPIVNLSGSRHTHVEYLSPMEAFGYTHLPNVLPLHPGQIPTIPFMFKNAGDYAVLRPQDSGLVVLLPFKSSDKQYDKLYKKLQFMVPGGNIPARSGNAAYHTVLGPELNATNMEQLRKQELSLCNVGAVRWSDETGRYETRIFQCLSSEDPVQGGYNWHTGPQNNEEKKLPFGVN